MKNFQFSGGMVKIGIEVSGENVLIYGSKAGRKL